MNINRKEPRDHWDSSQKIHALFQIFDLLKSVLNDLSNFLSALYVRKISPALVKRLSIIPSQSSLISGLVK